MARLRFSRNEAGECAIARRLTMPTTRRGRNSQETKDEPYLSLPIPVAGLVSTIVELFLLVPHRAHNGIVYLSLYRNLLITTGWRARILHTWMLVPATAWLIPSWLFPTHSRTFPSNSERSLTSLSRNVGLCFFLCLWWYILHNC